MSNHLGVKDTLAAINGLRETLREFARRDRDLTSAFKTRTDTELRQFRAASEAHATRAAAARDNAELLSQAEAKQLEEHYQQRKRRIGQAHLQSRNRALDAIRNQETQFKNKALDGTQQAESRRDAALTEAAARHDELQARAAALETAIAEAATGADQALFGFGRLRRSLNQQGPDGIPAPSGDPPAVLDQIQGIPDAVLSKARQLRAQALVQIGSFLPLWFLVLLAVAAAAAAWSAGPPRQQQWLAGAGVIVATLAGLRWQAVRRARPAARALADDLARARSGLDLAVEAAARRLDTDRDQARTEFDASVRQLNQNWRQSVRGAIALRDERPREIDEQAVRATARHESLHRKKLEQRIQRDTARQSTLADRARKEESDMTAAHRQRLAAIQSEEAKARDTLRSEWRDRTGALLAPLLASETAGATFPDWNDPSWDSWNPPDQFQNAARFGWFETDFALLSEDVPQDPGLALPGNSLRRFPATLIFPSDGSILFETNQRGGPEAIQSINNIIFRLLSTTPPGKLSFTIFDPVSLGQNFAGLMHLADYEESHINSRIWTQTGQLEEKLGDLNEHMEKVIQMYLRNEYATIAEYNAQAGSIAEKYHFLVIADFPANFSDTAARRLINIASSGARCGVFTLIHWDLRQPLPPGVVLDELRKNCVRLVHAGAGFKVAGTQPDTVTLALDPPPEPDRATDFLHRVGEGGRNTNRVEVPFSQVAPRPEDVWSLNTAEELRVPIGRSGATKLQYLALGRGTRQHVLVAGKTGSGKSTLFHVLINNLALWCGPDQVEFYLVDFKKGVEFKPYAVHRLPHARVVAIESDREFGLSVLERVDAELRRRGDLFRQAGAQDLAAFRRANPAEPMPRSLLIIDEFQEFFTEEDRVSQGAAVLLDRIVRQGRAFGIHVVLGSQTLGGAYTLARATIGQMVVRIALQCNEADAYLIMDQDNPAPRLLTRPGEGIYNDTSGSIEGNSPFQAVWLPEQEREQYLQQVRADADAQPAPPPGPFVFEGNAPADIRDNAPLRSLLHAPALKPADPPRIWLGAPNSIKGPTEVAFRRQSASNLLVVGQSEERTATLLGIALASLAAQYARSTARFILADSSPPGSPQRAFLDRIAASLRHPVELLKAGDLGARLAELAATLSDPVPDSDIYVLVNGAQNFKKLRQDDDFGISSSGDGPSPAESLVRLITEGPARGLHVVLTCDTYNNVNRAIGRRTLSEFESRVLFQMSASDSASLIDAPDAGTLGLHRALMHNDREGYTELFRPYGLPGSEWLDEAAVQLARLLP
ncbi:MAG: FtsK/SpoIIIE domain-containing protein [Verrucomicrobiota bacterium]